MSQARFKIVFSGELMPAAQLDEVKANLARLFKSDSAKIDSLFSGNPVALKRDLAEDEAEKYLAALQRAGALRFWVSRLWDFYLPREAALLQPHDPTHFERVLRQRVAHPLTAIERPVALA